MTRSQQPKATALDGEPQLGVTAQTYATKAKAFIEAHGGDAFVAALWPGSRGGRQWQASIREFGAWRSYFRNKVRMPTVVMDREGYVTVPAQWPHEFDALVSEIDDEMAADRLKWTRQWEWRKPDDDEAGKHRNGQTLARDRD